MSDLKIFWVLAWDHYYPGGGLRNVDSTHASREAAEEAAQSLRDKGEYDQVKVEDVSDLL